VNVVGIGFWVNPLAGLLEGRALPGYSTIRTTPPPRRGALSGATPPHPVLHTIISFWTWKRKFFTPLNKPERHMHSYVTFHHIIDDTHNSYQAKTYIANFSAFSAMLIIMNLILGMLLFVATHTLVVTKANRVTKRNYDDDDYGNYLQPKVKYNNNFNNDDFAALYNTPSKYQWGTDDIIFGGQLNTHHYSDDATDYRRQRTRRRKKKKSNKKGKSKI